MNMVFYTTHNLSDALRASDDSAKIRMKSWPPICVDNWSSLFRREDNVIVQREKSRAHESWPFFLALLRSANHCNLDPVVFDHRLLSFSPSGCNPHPLTRMVLTCWLTHLLPQEQAPMLTVRSGCGIHCCW